MYVALKINFKRENITESFKNTKYIGFFFGSSNLAIECLHLKCDTYP